MKVTLINYTQNAIETLLFTKQTRLTMSGAGFNEIFGWSEEKKAAELEYMRHTIHSQFEFVDYIFAIEGVTRAFTHQLVRRRVGASYAQQAQRAVDMSGFEYATGPSIAENEDRALQYRAAMLDINAEYQRQLKMGANPQDARGLLPTNICTNIVFKANLGTLYDMALKRLCVKTQGEFQDVFRAIRAEVLKVHPWADRFIRVWCAQHGTCQFHTFPTEDCPVKPIVYNPYTQEAYAGGQASHPDLIQIQWERNRAEAQPAVPKAK